MEGPVILLVLFLIWLLIAPIMALVRASNAEREAKEANDQVKGLLGRLKALENELRQTQRAPEIGPLEPVAAPSPAETHAALEAVLTRVSQEELRVETTEPPPLPLTPPPRRKLVDWGGVPAPVQEPAQQDFRPKPVPKVAFSLERFMGEKLFAWLGGIAMFFGVIFFVKYAFENNLIPPALRIALGFVTGTALLIGGLVTHRLPRYRVLAQVFCATGVLILYGVSFAAHSIYHFAAFGPGSTFALMGLITVVAFLLAVRLGALVVAVLGMLGGFLTPVMLSTGHDQVFGLFGYIALLDIGLLAVSRHGRWRFLTSAAAVGTMLMQMGWYEKFFAAGHYFEGSKTLIPMGILCFFIGVFLAGGWIRNRRQEMDVHSSGAILGLAAVAMFFAFLMLGFQQVAERYLLLYGFLLLVQAAVISIIYRCPRWGWAQMAAAGLAFIHLGLWSNDYLTADRLHGALALYLIFGALHAVVPVVMARRLPGVPAAIPLKASPWISPLVLLMMLLPVLHLSPVSMVIWPAILIVDLLVIALAAASGAIVPVLASLVLTMGVAAIWLLKIPARADNLLPFLGVITGFSAVFVLAGKWLVRSGTAEGTARSSEVLPASILPVCAGVLPFALMILALLQLPVANPSPVFGVALLMAALLAGLAILGKQGPLVLTAMLCTLGVEAVWHLKHFQAGAPMVPLTWYLVFYGLFLVFPFAYRKACAAQAEPWIASALSGAGHFLLVYQLVKRAFPNSYMGLLPAAFAIPALIALVVVVRMVPQMNRQQRSQMAWFGGVALLFITLIFPIQFSRQWLTVSWALEGAALLWLFRRVPHPGLQLTGLALLGISFARLTLNPAVFTDYPRSGTPILNWHLYAYGIAAVAQFFGGKWFTDPAGRLSQYQARGVLFSFGGVLLFLLLNIEIADYFTSPGERCVAFRFGGNFARDMTYSISWGLFSLGLLGLGFWKHSKHLRFAAIGLLVVTLIKVFLHDLAAIQNIFRIGALVGVAVIAFVASFLYQRFFDRSNAP